MNSFKLPLIEETRAEFCSGLESVGHAPACEISSIWFSKKYKPPKGLYYDILTKIIHDVNNHAAHYEPETGDIFAITNLRPRSIDDLIKPDKPLHFGYVSKYDDDELKYEILLSQIIDWEILSKKDGRLFVTYLMNVTTNMRIWRALNPDLHSTRLGPIRKMLQHDSFVSLSIVFSWFLASWLTFDKSVQKGSDDLKFDTVIIEKCPENEKNAQVVTRANLAGLN